MHAIITNSNYSLSVDSDLALNHKLDLIQTFVFSHRHVVTSVPMKTEAQMLLEVLLDELTG